MGLHHKFQLNEHIFRHASVSSTYPCKLVGWSVGWSVTLSDFQSLVSNGRSNKKSSKNKVNLFTNFASGRTLPTNKNVYGSVSPGRGKWPFRVTFFLKVERSH